MYATEGDTQHLDEYDQFIIYVNGDTKQFEFVEFTLRDLMKSYKADEIEMHAYETSLRRKDG